MTGMGRMYGNLQGSCSSLFVPIYDTSLITGYHSFYNLTITVTRLLLPMLQHIYVIFFYKSTVLKSVSTKFVHGFSEELKIYFGYHSFYNLTITVTRLLLPMLQHIYVIFFYKSTVLKSVSTKFVHGFSEELKIYF